jgi:hypothetical protein
VAEKNMAHPCAGIGGSVPPADSRQRRVQPDHPKGEQTWGDSLSLSSNLPLRSQMWILFVWGLIILGIMAMVKWLMSAPLALCFELGNFSSYPASAATPG